MSDDEITAIKVALATIATKLDAHFSRDDERAAKWEGHEDRLKALEAVENRRLGGRAAVAAIVTAASVIGGLVVKLWPIGVR